jgi:hypothetical protein
MVVHHTHAHEHPRHVPHCLVSGCGRIPLAERGCAAVASRSKLRPPLDTQRSSASDPTSRCARGPSDLSSRPRPLPGVSQFDYERERCPTVTSLSSTASLVHPSDARSPSSRAGPGTEASLMFSTHVQTASAPADEQDTPANSLDDPQEPPPVEHDDTRWTHSGPPNDRRGEPAAAAQPKDAHRKPTDENWGGHRRKTFSHLWTPLVTPTGCRARRSAVTSPRATTLTHRCPSKKARSTSPKRSLNRVPQSPTHDRRGSAGGERHERRR